MDAAIAVLLSTYNGAAFLPAQLQSLAEQQGATWRLLWRDDGSADGSAAAVEAFGHTMPGRVHRIDAPASRLGVAASYHALAQAAAETDTIAFCDQDDIWLADKLARGMAALRGAPPGLPALYCARQTLVDGALRPLGLSPVVRRMPGFAMALTQNIATGCTVMMNPAAAALFRAAAPPAETLHDWWSYLLVSAAGGRVIVDPVPAVLYRQHAGNNVGAPRGPVRRALAALRRGPKAFMTVFRGNVAALARHQALCAPEPARIVALLEHALARGPMTRLHILRRTRLRRQTWPETTLFTLWFLAG